MKLATILAFAALATASVATTDASTAAAAASNTLPRIHPAVHRTLRQQNTVNIFVTLKEGTANPINVVKEADFATRGQHIAALVQSLQTHAAKSQQEVSSLLAKESGSGALFTKTKSFWITNQVYVENATLELVEKLASLSSIAEITEEEVIPLALSPTADTTAADNSTTVEWGVDKINARAVWATGNTGQGVIVGVIDTGVRGTHEALASSYRNDGFSWLDPEALAEKPYDWSYHGSHVTGSITGVNGLGVAPGAKWIGCKGCRRRGCYALDLMDCFEFMTCPTNPSGTTKDCSKAPHVINNSWAGGRGNTYYQDVANTWRAAGIIPVFANGNSGPECATARSPAELPNVIGVGSTDVNDLLSPTSAKGPAVTGIIKPDISAPGVNVRSAGAASDSTYVIESGTSMATPHVTGVIALLLHAKPNLKFEQIKDALTKTAARSLGSTNFTCGGTSDSVWPNNQYGHGRVDAQAAVAYVKSL